MIYQLIHKAAPNHDPKAVMTHMLNRQD